MTTGKAQVNTLGFAPKVEIEMLQERKHCVVQNEPLHSAEAG